MINAHELLKNSLDNMSGLIKEQKLELKEAIRHFTKYKSLAMVSDELLVPQRAYALHDAMKSLFDEHYPS